MPLNTMLSLVAVFLSVALFAGAAASLVLSRAKPSQRRLSDLVEGRLAGGLVKKEEAYLTEVADPRWEAVIRMFPPPFDASKRLRTNLVFTGFDGSRAVALFLLSQVAVALILGAAGVFVTDDPQLRWWLAIFGAIVGFMLPGLLLGRRVRAYQKEVQNGLADALDLLVLCLGAGSGLDQAIVKASAELELSYPILAAQLQTVITEMRAGKPRIDAFRGLATRTRVDDARALVTMLVQTEKFGTSIAQALRTHASDCRTKRRQRAEERAEKVGVKLVFPLVFCLFPALFVVILGPAMLQFLQLFGSVQP